MESVATIPKLEPLESVSTMPIFKPLEPVTIMPQMNTTPKQLFLNSKPKYTNNHKNNHKRNFTYNPTSFDKKKKKHKKSSSKNGLGTNNAFANLYDKKKKKSKKTGERTSCFQLSAEHMKRMKNDTMKIKLCEPRFGDFAEINVEDRTVYWGLGIEHEMQLFHKNINGMKNTNIMFDSQESTCVLTNEKDPAGACCKLTKNHMNPTGKCNDFTPYTKPYGDFGLTKEEKQYLLNMTWEITGRQARGCEKNKPLTIIKSRASIVMPELITTNYANRSVDSIWKEMTKLEEKYIAIHMKNPYTQQKVAKYGQLTAHLCGSHSNLMVPIRPTIHTDEYQFEPNVSTDYLGSYHVTITLPHTRNIDVKEFISMHQNMAQQIQWIEPLFLTAFFSPTQSAVGNHNQPEGSYRVMTIGWGNFAGSNIRKMGTKGLDRGGNIRSLWRKGLNFKGTKRLNLCAETSPPQYKKATTMHTGDFRTMGMETNMAKCESLYNPDDCPRADGAPMRPPYGMEIRIFDHFPSEYLLDLLRIITLIGCNAQRHQPKDYVYRDKRWIEAMRSIMTDGWNAKVDSKFITTLRYNLGLPINTNSLMAYDIFKQLVHELHEANKDAFYNKLMNEHPEIEPKVPEINRMCWEMAFTQNYNLKIVNFLKRSFHTGQVISIGEFTRMVKEDGTLDYTLWENDINDLLYALETHNHVHLDIFDGKIKNVKFIG